MGKYRNLIWVLGVALALSACGGGGSASADGAGSGGTGGVPPPTPGTELGTAILLDGSTTLISSEADLGIAANGDAIAVWTHRESSGQFRVTARRYINQSWSAMEMIDSVDMASKSAYYARIAMNSKGEAIVAWVQGNDALPPLFDAGSIWVRNYDPATGWGVATEIASADTMLPPMDCPAVSIAEDGTRRVVWNRMLADFTNTAVYARQLHTGQANWDPTVTLDELPTEKRELGLVIDTAGNAMAWWKHYTTRSVDSNDVFDLEARRFVASTSAWEATTFVADAVEENGSSKVAATMVASNDVIFAWESIDPSNGNSMLHSRRYQNGTLDGVVEQGIGGFPDLVSSNGNATLASTHYEIDTATQTYRSLATARAFSAGANSWDDTNYNLDPASGATNYMHVATNNNGQSTAVWSHIDIQGGMGMTQRLYANYYDANTWQSVAQVIAGSANGDMALRIKLSDSGGAIVLWQRGATLWASHYHIPQ